MDNKYVISGFLLAIPTAILIAVPLYNRVDPQFLGLPFFYWFQGLWLVIAAIFYIIAGILVTSKDVKGDAE